MLQETTPHYLGIFGEIITLKRQTTFSQAKNQSNPLKSEDLWMYYRLVHLAIHLATTKGAYAIPQAPRITPQLAQ